MSLNDLFKEWAEPAIEHYKKWRRGEVKDLYLDKMDNHFKDTKKFYEKQKLLNSVNHMVPDKEKLLKVIKDPKAKK